MIRRLFAALGGAACVLAVSPSAFAYCRTTTCDARTQDCGVLNGCQTQGQALYWASSCTSFSVQKDGSPLRGISADTAEGVIRKAYYHWLQANCGNGTTPSISIMEMPQVSCSKQQFNQDGGNANIWMFRDAAWPYEGSSETLALTTLTFNIKTGEIYDADVEINSHDKSITVGDTNVQADLESIVTHEAGHVFGLAHSPSQYATMFASYNPGQTSLRTLNADDIAGICDIYPANRSVTGSSCDPRGGFATACDSKHSSDSGCTIGRPAQGSPYGMLAAFAALSSALVCFARYRSRAR